MMLVPYESKVSRYFHAGELFEDLPAAESPEYALSRLMAMLILDPIRDRIGKPLIINSRALGRTRSGWRTHPVLGVGAAGTSSDHMILGRNPLAVGAVDIISTAVPEAEVFAAAVDLVCRGEIPEPREILLERAGSATWVHIAGVLGWKANDPLVRSRITDPHAVADRPMRLNSAGKKWPFWTIEIADGAAKRVAYMPD